VCSIYSICWCRRQVANRDGNTQLLGQPLPFYFPETQTGAVAAAAMVGDHQPAGFGIAFFPHGQPPAVNRVDSETGGIVIGADTDPALLSAMS